MEIKSENINMPGEIVIKKGNTKIVQTPDRIVITVDNPEDTKENKFDCVLCGKGTGKHELENCHGEAKKVCVFCWDKVTQLFLNKEKAEAIKFCVTNNIRWEGMDGMEAAIQQVIDESLEKIKKQFENAKRKKGFGN